MPVIHEGSSAFSAAQDFVIQFNIGAREARQSKIGKNFVKSKGAVLSHSSIMKATRDLTMRFPVICSDTISPGAASMVVKAIERNCTTTLQLLFASTYLRGDNGIDVLRKFHKNIDDNITMDDYLNMADALTRAIDSKVSSPSAGKLNDAINFINAFGENCTEKDFVSKAIKDLNEQTSLDDDYAERSIAGYHITEAADGSNNFTVVLKEAFDPKNYHPPKNNKNNKNNNKKNNNNKNESWMDNYREVLSGLPILRPDINGTYKDMNGNSYYRNDVIQFPNSPDSDPIFTVKDLYKKAMDDKNIAQDQQKLAYDRLKFDTDQNYNNKKLALDKRKLKLDQDRLKLDQDAYQLNMDKYTDQKVRDEYHDALDAQRADMEFFQKQLLDNDVKKCNELVPSLIIIRYNNVDATAFTKAAVEQQFIAGVKAWMYPESSGNIINKVSDVFSKNKGKLGWIKATTGEINFMKDFLLGIGKAKIEAKQDAYERVSPIWKHLKYRSNKSVLNRLIKNKPNDAGAITTLVLSSEEVDYMKKEMDINLTDIRTAQKLMEAYNFMGIVIVDENFEVARFLFDGAAYYEDIAFSSLEREDKDSSYKKVVNLISKINRG